MLLAAEAESHGAITIINAMATGKGAALGIKLWTRATVTVTNNAGMFKARNLSDPDENSRLAEVTAQRVFAHCGAGKRFGAVIETESNIPIAVGLKSSSAVSNAVALASFRILQRHTNNLDVVRMGVEASLRAGVTLTGAYDDACACYFGGLIITDNARRMVLKRFNPKGKPRVLIHVPRAKRYTRDVNIKPLRAIRSIVQIAHREALRGNYWNSMTLNGLIYSMALGYDASIAKTALDAGATAAGLTGKGPAVAAIVPESKRDDVLKAWRQYGGRIIDTTFNFEKAAVWRLTG